MSVIVWFAANPEKQLTSKQVCALTGMDPLNLYGVMNASVRSRWLNRTTPGRGRAVLSVYTAGEKLLRTLEALK